MTTPSSFSFKLPLFLALVAVVGTHQSTSDASVVITYDFLDGTGAGAKTGTDAAKVTAGAFTPVGAAGISSNSDMAFLSMGNTGSDLASALDNANYFSVTLSAANVGEVLDLNSMTLDFGGSTNGGSATINLVVQSSVGGFGTGNPTLTVTPSSNTIVGNSGEELTPATVDVSSAGFDNLSTVTFQFRFFDNSNTANSFDRLDNVAFEAAVIPEPATVGLLMGGFAALALAWCRRTKG